MQDREEINAKLLRRWGGAEEKAQGAALTEDADASYAGPRKQTACLGRDVSELVAIMMRH